MFEALAFVVLTVSVFLFWMHIQNRLAWLILNPVVTSMVSIIAILHVFNVDHDRYMSGGKYIDWLIEPAVVLLGYPLYKQLHMIRKQWRELIFICAVAVVSVLCCSTLMACAVGLEPWIISSLVTLNITTPIAMETTQLMGGEPALAACLVLVAGFTGGSLGLYCLDLIGVKEERSAGLAIGSMSHALGTAVIARRSYTSSAYASTALILCAILTAIIAPVLVPSLLALFS